MAMLNNQRVLFSHFHYTSDIFTSTNPKSTWLKEGVVGDSMEPASDPLVMGKVDDFFLGKC